MPERYAGKARGATVSGNVSRCLAECRETKANDACRFRQHVRARSLRKGVGCGVVREGRDVSRSPMAFNCARARYRIRRGEPQTFRELRLMRAGARDRWLSTALLSEHAAFFSAQVQYHQALRRGEAVTLSTFVGLG